MNSDQKIKAMYVCALMPGLSPAARKLAFALLWHLHPDVGLICPGTARLTRGARIGRSTAMDAKAELTTLKLVTIERRRNGSKNDSNSYRFNVETIEAQFAIIEGLMAPRRSPETRTRVVREPGLGVVRKPGPKESKLNNPREGYAQPLRGARPAYWKNGFRKSKTMMAAEQMMQDHEDYPDETFDEQMERTLARSMGRTPPKPPKGERPMVDITPNPEPQSNVIDLKPKRPEPKAFEEGRKLSPMLTGTDGFARDDGMAD
jgi:hypothetical protein